jgi:hypothetical protein
MSTRELAAERLAAVAGVVEAPSQFGHPVGYWLDGKEVGHLEGDAAEFVEVEIRLGRKLISARRTELKADARIELRRNTSDWLTIGCRTKADIEDAVKLLELVQAHP